MSGSWDSIFTADSLDSTCHERIRQDRLHATSSPYTGLRPTDLRCRRWYCSQSNICVVLYLDRVRCIRQSIRQLRKACISLFCNCRVYDICTVWMNWGPSHYHVALSLDGATALHLCIEDRQRMAKAFNNQIRKFSFIAATSPN
jgi:hypothetical protein